MADKKITQLTDLGDGLAAVDLFHVVDDPTGTPINKKIAAQDVFNNMPTYLGIANGSDGQVKTFLNVSTGGTNAVTITPASLRGYTNIILNAPGETVTCIFKNSNWNIIAGNGYTTS